MSSRLARLQHSLLLSVAAGEELNLAALGGFNAGVATILNGNRDATDVELLALENASDSVLCKASGGGGVEAAPPLSLPPSGDETDSGVTPPEAGGTELPQDASVTAVAPPDAGVVPAPAEHPVDLSQPDVQHLDATAYEPVVPQPDESEHGLFEDDGA